MIEHYRLSLHVVTWGVDDDKHKISSAANLQREYLKEKVE